MALFRLIASLCLSLHILCGIAAAQDLSVDVSFEPNFLAVEGRTVGECIVNKRGSDVVSSIVWRHNGSIVQPVPDRIIIDTDLVNARSELEIDLLILSDAGTYTCQALFSIPTGASATGMATLRVATTLVVTAAEEQDFLEGDIANLTCSAVASPSPTIQWFSVDEDLTRVETLTEKVDFEDEDYGVYMIPDVERSDGRLYECEGSYNFGRMSVYIRLFVISFPEILTDPLIDSEVMKGENLTLECETASQRPPIYIWSFEGDELTNSSRISVGEISGELNITNLTFADTGTYNCYVENDFGNDTQNSSIVVAGSPEILSANNTVICAGLGNRVALNCSFLGYPPPTIEWSKLPEDGDVVDADAYVPINTNANGRLSINTTNGSFLIGEAVGSDRGVYSCNISNVHGSDSRFNITLKVIEPAPAPSELRVLAGSEGDRSVSLEWVYVDVSALPEYRRPDRFAVEARLDDNPEYELLDQSFFPNETAGTLTQLVPGTQFKIRIRAANLAGVSQPSNAVLYTSVETIPRFLFFNATALDDGRNILLRWELEFDGGPDIVLFEVKFFDSEGTLLDTFELDIDAGSYLVQNLDPVTTYSFSAMALNGIGPTASIIAQATTTLAPPSKPTQPVVRERTIHSLTFSFSVENGSRPIEYFVLNITEVDMPDSLQLNFSVTDEDFIEDFSELVADGSEEVTAYTVVVRVRDELENRREYIFIVAAGSEIGLGEFSNSSDPFSLRDDRLIYYIVAAVVGGVLVVVVVIIIVIVISCCVKRCRRRGRTMLITGKHTTSTTSTDFMLKQEQYNTDVNYGTENVDRADTTSPFYNNLAQYPNGGQSYGIDEPDTRFSTSPNSVPSSQFQKRLSGQSSTLPRASMGSGPDSVVSEKHFPGSPPGTLRGQDPTLSFSTPVITDRYSSDMETLQKSTSYMTDV